MRPYEDFSIWAEIRRTQERKPTKYVSTYRDMYICLLLIYHGNTMSARLTDWRCTGCHAWNVKAAKYCGKCARVALPRVKFSRARIHGSTEDNRTMGSLRKKGL